MEVPVKVEATGHCDAVSECDIRARENCSIPVSVAKNFELSARITPVTSVSAFYLFSKRMFDLVFSFIGIIICFIPMLLVAASIVIESKGGAIFKQERLGLNGVPFTMYKFRSMRIDAEANGPQWAADNDPRCTKVGRFIRLVRLDELPQLFNILKGDMSFVGPRPERKCFYEEFEKTIPGFSDRLAVKPGLTGLAQIEGGYLLPPSEKIVYDREYIRTRSMKLDISCMLKTIRIVITHEGAR